ncbi:karyopherin [Schizosaccharomyces japonicus yFS275]|uniref:Karyopherin n=1 Tax=Schizosaccharomyces japonicus (strain yFS275 / FY16936) TaxID=402676 RepID=B6K4X8_SCHJY|nr:karyopherin [Schizosaccharomyces japonicus yFS275]EEB08535.1 karyopherin [Schizosaccharomyces japonicus yFS275]
MSLVEHFDATLSSDQNVRARAELSLKQLEKEPDFVLAVLQLLGNEGIELSTRQAAVIYLKNRIARSWSSAKDAASPLDIPEDKKAIFRQNLLPVLLQSPVSTRSHLMAILNIILSTDFPDQWPSFVEFTANLVQSSDAREIYAGLICMHELAKVYRWRVEDRCRDIGPVITSLFPCLLQHAQRLVAQDDDASAEMLRLILKTFKSVVSLEIPIELLANDNIFSWIQLLLAVVQRALPASVMSIDADVRSSHVWLKCKKWAYFTLNRLFTRYGLPTSVSRDMSTEYKTFAQTLQVNVVPNILQVYLSQTALWIQGQVWLSPRLLFHLGCFYEDCVKPKNTWVLLQPHVENLVAHFIFPQLCMSEEDEELWEMDQVEFIHKYIDIYDDFNSPDVAASRFLVKLASRRAKQTFMGILNFATGMLNKYASASAQEKNPREKEGALRMVGSISHAILAKNSPVVDMMQDFIVVHVLPEFTSTVGYLRSRACEMINRFADIKWSDKNQLLNAYNSVLNALRDEALAVRVQAALALQPLMRHTEVHTAITPHVPMIMQTLLQMANEIDIDALSSCMEDFVSMFSHELTPFASQLCVQLRDTFMKLMRESLEQTAADDMDSLPDDKSIAAAGILNTLSTMILSLENTVDVLQEIERVLLPLFTFTLDNSVWDVFSEVFEIVDGCTFVSKSISPVMWTVFEKLQSVLKDSAIEYIEDCSPALNNYVMYGADALRSRPDYLSAMVEIIHLVFTNDHLALNDRVAACKLAELLMLHLPGCLDQYLQSFIELAGDRLLVSEKPSAGSYRVFLIEVIVNALCYNALATLQVLEAHQWTAPFFTLWFNDIGRFARVHDKKISMLAIVSLLSLPNEQVPPSLQSGWCQMLQVILTLLASLPEAMKNRAQIERDYDGEAFDMTTANWDEHGDWDAEDDETANDFATGHPEGAFSDDEEYVDDFACFEGDYLLEEDPLFHTPLDRIEPYAFFREFVSHMESSNPASLQHLVSGLSGEQQQFMQALLSGSVPAANPTQKS